MSTRVDLQGDTLTVTRVFDAPREDVFDAWVEVSKVQVWWGCNQTTNVRSEVEPRVGGEFSHCMTHEELGEITVPGRITEFERPSKLTWVQPNQGEGDGPQMQVAVTFTDVGGRTEVRLEHSGLVDPMTKECIPKGWSAAMEKLGRFLTEAA